MSMRPDEIRSNFEKDVYDNDAFDKFLERKRQEFKKVQKNVVNNQSCIRLYPYFSKESNQKYILAMMVSTQYGDKQRHTLVIADVDGGEKGRLFVMGSKGYNLTHAIRVHFLNRHNERMGYHDETTMKKLARYLLNGYFYCSFWYEEEDKRYKENVCGCQHGIALCEVDTKYYVRYYHTFVTKEMLKDSQRRAFEKVVSDDFENRSAELYRTFRKSEREGLEWLEGLDISESERRKMAKDIYNEYFE